MVAQAVRIKNKMSGLLMEVGAEYNKQQLQGKKYFTELLGSLEEGPESVKELPRLSRGALEMFETTQQSILDKLRREPRLMQRLEVLKSIRGVGDVTALSWALEICDPHRFASIGDAVSYCGLSSALVSSADKQRNAHLQTVLIKRRSWRRDGIRSWRPCTSGRWAAGTAIGPRF
jgi:transposase